MKGNPQNMRDHVEYSDLMKEMVDYFHEKIHRLQRLDVKDIIVDPGFGFAKTREHGFGILHNLQGFSILGRPLLVGLSRKSMVWKTLDVQPADALNGTTALNAIALMKGASILRVHDVKEAKEVIKLFTSINDSSI
jgi:dihydropteroate synthase